MNGKIAYLRKRDSVCLFARPSICPSVTFRCLVQKNEDTIVRFSASCRTIILVYGEVKFIWIFAVVLCCVTPSEGILSEALPSLAKS